MPHSSDRQAEQNIDTAALARLYQHPSDYLWLEQQQLTIQAYDALAFIASSTNHGLNPNDYHHELLQQLDPADQAEAHLFDLMLSDGLLKLIRDIASGRLDPSIVDPKWSIPRSHFDATAFLQQALNSGQFDSSLRSLIPTSAQYQKLTAAAERYQHHVERGGWPAIADLPNLRPGDFNQHIPAIRRRLAFEDNGFDVSNPDQPEIYDDNLKQAIKRFQKHHSLYADGIIGPATVRAMNVPAAARLQQININLERLRWLPDDLGERYIMVNLANYQLTAIEDDEIKLHMRVIVGKAKRSTPSFSSKMTHIVLNPKWYIPHKLARLDLLPKQQKNPDYFSRFNIRVFATVDGSRREINPDTVDWHSLTKHNFPYSLVQDAGERNALGQLKFILPNPWRIYLHDTPSKSLFNRSARNFSSGCIRVEDPLALAEFSLTGNGTDRPLLESIESRKSYRTKLAQPLSVYAIYATVWLNGDDIVFSPDSYRRDQKMAGYL